MKVKQISRRSFLELAAVTGAALGAGSVFGKEAFASTDSTATVQTASAVQKIRTCCRACGKNECGVWAFVQDGRVIRTEGDESAFQSMGNHCSKGQASLQAAYHPDRVIYPLKRTNPKGDDDPGWVRISWDEALAISGEKLMEIKERYGGHTLFFMAGTSRIWSMAPYRAWPQLFDSPNSVIAWQICKGPRHWATGMCSQFNWSWMATGDRPDVFVAWGGASEISNYDESGRSTVEEVKNAKEYILCDPRMTGLGHEATIRQQMVPGTDGALAMAWMNTIIEDEEGLDYAYIKRWTNAPYLVVDGMEPSGGQDLKFVGSTSADFKIATRLLKECDLVEGGDNEKWFVWDELAGTDEDHPLHQYGKLTYFDNNTCLWEGEAPDRETEFYESPQENLLTAQGRIAKIAKFDPEIEPALNGEFEVTLKDGKTYTAHPVWTLLRARAAEYTPEKVQDIVGIPADQIRHAALTYAHRIDHGDGRDYGNGGIQYMLALEHACNAIQNNRMMDILVGITGNMDTPAGNRGGTEGTLTVDAQTCFATGHIPESRFQNWGKYRLGADKFPTLNWWQFWADAASVWEAIETGEPYQPRGGICQSGDHMVMANSIIAYEGLKKLDFFLTIDMWKTPTAGMSDIILPCAHWLEVNSPRLSQGSTGAQGATVAAVPPRGESRTDIRITIDMHRACHEPWMSPMLADPANLPLAYSLGSITQFALVYAQFLRLEPDLCPTEESYLDYTVSQCEYNTWETYKQAFQEHGWWDCKIIQPVKWGTYRRFESGAIRPDGTRGWNTPTRKQEIWSTVMESTMPDAGFELPTWDPAPRTELADPDIVKEYPFLMTTGRRIPVYFHSEHRQLPWCRELWPAPRVEINPDDAAKLGIKQGDWVWIESDMAKVRQTADLYYGVKPGIINAEHQWWFPELEQADHGFTLSGINCLVNPYNRDPICGAANLRAYNVKVYKATPENSPFGNPVPCDNNGVPIIWDSDDDRLKAWNKGVFEVRDGNLDAILAGQEA